MKYTLGKNPNSRNGFKKGHKVNLGKKRSKESREKLMRGGLLIHNYYLTIKWQIQI